MFVSNPTQLLDKSDYPLLAAQQTDGCYSLQGHWLLLQLVYSSLFVF